MAFSWQQGCSRRGGGGCSRICVERWLLYEWQIPHCKMSLLLLFLISNYTVRPTGQWEAQGMEKSSPLPLSLAPPSTKRTPGHTILEISHLWRHGWPENALKNLWNQRSKMVIMRVFSFSCIMYSYLYQKKPFSTTLHPLRGDTGYLSTILCWENLDPGHWQDLRVRFSLSCCFHRFLPRQHGSVWWISPGSGCTVLLYGRKSLNKIIRVIFPWNKSNFCGFPQFGHAASQNHFCFHIIDCFASISVYKLVQIKLPGGC